MFQSHRQIVFPVREYDLEATLSCGQAFRWKRCGENWEGVVGSRWVRLSSTEMTILAEVAEDMGDWTWLAEYLQAEIDLSLVVAEFPQDPPMLNAVAACRGLRLLRQDPWECLASFILSSTKQIIQIQQIVELLCERLGQSVAVPVGHAPCYAFPEAARIAATSEAELRGCKMGFRAPYLKESAGIVSRGELDLRQLGSLSVGEARERLMELPGVGRKIADCVLLFAYGHQSAFPVDVWVMKALRELYFRRRRVKLKRLQSFSETHFGIYAGYAQQYLFHYMRLQEKTGRP
jgi:N-glycosylase/DNA lyase